MTADWSFADRDFSVFPLTPNAKTPALDWGAFSGTRATPAQLVAWRQHNWNMGVATGALSGVFVLDCDSLLARIEAERLGIPPTLLIRTPRGYHFYFKHPGWPVKNRGGKRWTASLPGGPFDGMDLRGDGGFVVGPGSRYVPTPDEAAAGKVAGTYAIEHDLPVADAPDWLLALTFPKEAKPASPPSVAEETSPYGLRALHAELAILAAAVPGERNVQVNASAFAIGQLVGGGEIAQGEGWEALQEGLAALCVEDDEAMQDTARRGWEAGLSNPRAADPENAMTPEKALGVRSTLAPAAPVDLGRPFVPPVKPRFVGPTNIAGYFAGCVYVARRDEIFHPAGLLLGRSAFDALYSGPAFVEGDEGEKKEKSAWTAFRQNSHSEMPKAWDVCFRPELAPGTIVSIEGLPFLNTYVPVVTPRQEGDASRFVGHVRTMLPHGQDADLLLHWMASCVQNPGAKFQWWPVVQGVQGNGKSLLLDCMIAAVGERYSHKVKADSVMKTGNQFNEWIERKLFLGFEEIRTSEGRRDFVEMMKDTVTARRLSTEGKGKGQATSDNRANGMMLTNHDDAVPVDDAERRWGIFYCAQQQPEDLFRDGMTSTYFASLYDWLRDGGHAIVTHFLATMPLQASLDPARGLQRAPETTSTREAVKRSLGLVEQEILDAIEGGLHGFRGGLVTSLALRGLLDRLRRTIAPRQFRKIMASVGYEVHPTFTPNRGRPNNALSDGTLPVLYFAKNSQILAERDGSVILSHVEEILRGGVGASNVVPFRR